jgi:hypothetical protein
LEAGDSEETNRNADLKVRSKIGLNILSIKFVEAVIQDLIEQFLIVLSNFDLFLLDPFEL